MNRTWPRKTTLALAVCLLGAALPGADLEELKRLDAEIAAAVDRELAESFTEAGFAARKGVAYPFRPLERTIAEVYRDTQDKAAAEVDRRLPDLSVDDLRKAAEKRYPLHRKGDRVVLDTRLPTSPSVSGVVNDVGQEKVIVGSRWIHKKDLYPRDRLAFDPALTREARRKYVGGLVRKRTALRQEFLRKLVRNDFPAMMRKHGYQEDPAPEAAAADLLAPEHWTTPETLFRREYRAARDQAREDGIRRRRQETLPGRGYHLDAASGRWRPMTALERLGSRFGAAWHGRKRKPGK